MIKKNIATNEFGFVFNPATGDSYSSNPIAAEIIQLMKDGHSLNEIKKTVCALIPWVAQEGLTHGKIFAALLYKWCDRSFSPIFAS